MIYYTAYVVNPYPPPPEKSNMATIAVPFVTYYLVNTIKGCPICIHSLLCYCVNRIVYDK